MVFVANIQRFSN